MAANTLSLYLKSPLFERVKEAHDDPSSDFNYRDICSEALERALAGPEQPQPEGVDVNPPEISLNDIAAAAALAGPFDQEEFEYEIHYLDGASAAKAFLDNAVSNGGFPVSMWADITTGKLGLLCGWPKVPVPVPVG
jgi:hypothetical protein